MCFATSQNCVTTSDPSCSHWLQEDPVVPVDRAEPREGSSVPRGQEIVEQADLGCRQSHQVVITKTHEMSCERSRWKEPEKPR